MANDFLLADVENNEAAQLAEESRDALHDYETGLIGHVSHDCIVRLPGEPTDQEEFLKLRSRHRVWLRGGSYLSPSEERS